MKRTGYGTISWSRHYPAEENVLVFVGSAYRNNEFWCDHWSEVFPTISNVLWCTGLVEGSRQKITKFGSKGCSVQIQDYEIASKQIIFLKLLASEGSHFEFDPFSKLEE